MSEAGNTGELHWTWVLLALHSSLIARHSYLTSLRFITIKISTSISRAYPVMIAR